MEFLLFLKGAVGVSIAKVFGNYSILMEEEIVPLRGTVVFSLGCPEEPEM